MQSEKSSFNHLAVLFLYLSISLLATNNACAQVLNGRDTAEGVFVRDSALAVDRLALAQRMEHLKEWDKAAEVYQDIVKNFPDRLVPSQVDKNNQICQYSSVTPLVQAQLARWPKEALAIYRARYEADAAALLETANNDPTALGRVVSFYFVTDAAKQSALRLMDLYLERGEFAAAAWVGQRMVNWHPALGDDKAQFLFRTALADHLAGNEDRAQASLKDLTAQFPQVTANFRGASVNLSQALAEELASPPGQTRPAEIRPDSWPMAFGSPDRARVDQVTAYGGAHLMSIDLEKPNVRNIQPSQRQAMLSQYATDMTQGYMTGIFPVVDHGELFFQDNANIYAVSLENDSPLPGWAETYKGEHSGHYNIPGSWPDPHSHQSTLTVTSDSVLAVMGQPDLVAPNFTGNYAMRETRLVCLDRHTGQEKWVAMPKKFPDSASSLREVDLTGSPLVIGDTVYVQGRGGKGMQFEDSYVLSFELATGKLKWAAYIASANSGAQYWQQGLGTILGQNESHLAYSNGRIFTLTNLGAVAAVDAYDGSIVWLNIYPRQVPDQQRIGWGGGGWRGWQNNRRNQATQSVRPWIFNPVIVSGNNVFVLPSDGMNVQIYDTGTGSEVKTIPMSAFEQSQVMLGVVDNKLIVHSDRQIFCIDWPKYESKAKSTLWASSSLQTGGSFDSAITGRGVVTSDSVVVPTSRKLFRLTLESGKIVQTYPAGENGSWADDEGSGNLLVTSDRLIIAGPTAGGNMRVNVYADLTMAAAKLEAAIAAAPNDPSIRLRYADILFAANKYEEAAAKLDDTIGLLGSGNATNAAMRDRVFWTAMNYAQKLAKDSHPQNLDLAAALFDRAGVTASTVKQKVGFRLGRAALANQRNQVETEVKLYQQILLDPDLRSEPVADSDGKTLTAGENARLAIDEAILHGGAAAYAPFEQAASDGVLAAAKAGDPEKLQAIAVSYPNSSSASRALLLAADVYESANNPRRATQVLRQAYFRLPAGAERDRVVEALARNYLRLPNRLDVAIARLMQGAGPNPATSPMLTKPLILPDGKRIENVTFAEAAKSLEQFRVVAATHNLPDMNLPKTQDLPPRGQQVAPFSKEDPATVIQRVGGLLVPATEFSRNDRVVTFSPNVGVRVFAIGGNQPLITADLLKQQPKLSGAAWIGPNLLVWNESELAYLAPDSGQTLWSWTIKKVAPLDVLASGEPRQDPAPVNVVPQPPPQVQVFRGPQIVRLPGGGQIRIQGGGMLQIQGMVIGQVPQPQPDPIVKPAEEQIVQVCPLSDRVVVGTTEGRVISLDLDGGRLLWQASLGDHAAVQLLANDDFVVGRMNDESNVNSQVVVFDASSGHVLARRGFGAETGDSSLLTNLALSPDGMLVMVIADRLYGKDLFEPGGLDKPTYQFGARPGEASNFTQATNSDQLQISGDKIVVASVDPAGTILRVLSARTGSVLRWGQDEAILRLDNSTLNGRFSVRCVGSVLYAITQRAMYRLNMDTGGKEKSLMPQISALSVRDASITRGHVIALTEPNGARFRGQPEGPTTMLQMVAFSRATDANGVESGLLEHTPSISNGNMMITGWQIVDGGIYFLAGDRLHLWRGNGGNPALNR